MKAVAGSANTFITGAADPNPAIANDYGLGPAAVRCIGVATNAACCFQGFTLRDGRASYHADNADSDTVHGAALLNAYGISSTYGGVLADCVITNCVSSRGVVFGGTLERCRMTGCNVTKLGLLRSCRVLASVFEHNPGGGMVIGQKASAYNCTFAANSCPVLASGYGNVYGCVMGGNGTADVYGSFEAMRYSLYALKNVTVDGSNVNETPIKFVSSETGDWRLLSTSAGTALSLLTYYSYNGYLPVTFDGVPFAATDGRIPAGAFSVRAVTTNYVDAVRRRTARPRRRRSRRSPPRWRRRSRATRWLRCRAGTRKVRPCRRRRSRERLRSRRLPRARWFRTLSRSNRGTARRRRSLRVPARRWTRTPTGAARTPCGACSSARTRRCAASRCTTGIRTAAAAAMRIRSTRAAAA